MQPTNEPTRHRPALAGWLAVLCQWAAGAIDGPLVLCSLGAGPSPARARALRARRPKLTGQVASCMRMPPPLARPRGGAGGSGSGARALARTPVVGHAHGAGAPGRALQFDHGPQTK